MRRLKADVLDGLPEKHVHRKPARMPTSQAEAYAKLVADARAGRLNGLEALHHLRGVSLHPEGAGSGLDDGAWLAGSARLTQAVAILDDVATRAEKALLFCESLDVQERLAELLRQRYRLPRRPAQITGEVAGTRRQAAVDAFQAAVRGFDVMLLTPRAGGVGLTLTAANHVVHLSRWWNPAVEDQCTDRVFRIGQERPCHVWYPMATHPLFPGGSFDEALDALLERKRALTRRLLVPPVGPDDEADLLRATVGQ
jgi:SNF2 family DNA or RNA helicase